MYCDSIYTNENVHFDSIPSRDHYSSGMISTITLNENVAQFNLIAKGNAMVGSFILADADLIGLMPCVAMALEAGDDGNDIKALFKGFVRDDT